MQFSIEKRIVSLYEYEKVPFIYKSGSPEYEIWVER